MIPGRRSKRDPATLQSGPSSVIPGPWVRYSSVSAPSWTRLLGPCADSDTKSVVKKYHSNHFQEPRGVHVGREFTGSDCLSILSLFIPSILPSTLLWLSSPCWFFIHLPALLSISAGSDLLCQTLYLPYGSLESGLPPQLGVCLGHPEMQAGRHFRVGISATGWFGPAG